LAEKFPDVASLTKVAKDGKIDFHKLRDLLTPYILGERVIPESTP